MDVKEDELQALYDFVSLLDIGNPSWIFTKRHQYSLPVLGDGLEVRLLRPTLYIPHWPSKIDT